MALVPHHPEAESKSLPVRRSLSVIFWRVVLFLPVFGLCFPSFYARATPVLFGFPFFYWYQLAWVLVSAVLMLVVYRNLRD